MASTVLRGVNVLGASVLSAVATYLLVMAASRLIDDQGFALLNVWLSVLTFAVVVAFSPVEALAPRIVGFGDRHGIPRAESRRDVSTLAAAAFATAVVIVAIGAYPLVSTLFEGAYSALVMLAPALAVYCLQSVQKGLAVGELRTRRLLVMQLCLFAVMGIGIVVIIATPGLHYPAYFMALLAAGVAASVVGGWLVGGGIARVRLPLAGATPVFRDGGSLMISAAATQAMTIAPVPVFAILEPADSSGIAILAGTLLICRVPTLLMVPVNALLISRMTDDAAHGRPRAVTWLGLRMAGVVLVLGLVGALVLIVVGALLLRVLIGSQYQATPMLFFWEMVVVALMSAASVLRLGVLSLGHAGHQVPIWIAAIAAFGLALLLPFEAMTSVVVGQLLAGGVALLGLMVLLLRADARATGGPDGPCDALAAPPAQ